MFETKNRKISETIVETITQQQKTIHYRSVGYLWLRLL